ncbi:hypothetical protein [Aphanizomenon flos-aquae]|uniref:hypothetical protein n=1 Tax=Aphanizomenon flos-aquae TaxID=1176 RepID=UPI0004B67F52|nr:hypothetical protein [Aphanizomenon flos-aquae]
MEAVKTARVGFPPRSKETRLPAFPQSPGGSHSLWINPQTGVIEAVPRHTEIKEFLAQKILKNLNAE